MRTLDVIIPQSEFKIDHHQPLALIGSCFSDEISSHFELNGFDTHSNPFGTIFHPSVIARFLNELCTGCLAERIVLREDVWLSWDAGSGMYAMSEGEIKRKLSSERSKWRELLSSASVLFITFGTAWRYELIESKLIVANCHKFSSGQFERAMSKAEDLLVEWKEVVKLLNRQFPDLKLVFTVSPVRHSKEGLVENNRSKAELIRLVAELEQLNNCSYFPSYELVLDVLRDYRYFTQDLVHPSLEAVQFVWEKIESTYFDQKTLELAKLVRQLKLSEEHRSLHPESKSSMDFRLNLGQKKQQLLADFPFLKKWD